MEWVAGAGLAVDQRRGHAERDGQPDQQRAADVEEEPRQQGLRARDPALRLVP